MIVKATHNAFLYRFFILYTKMKIRSAFREVIISGNVSDRELPVLVVANHFSWWDGFWIMYMNMKLFGRKFYFMMLEEQLRKHMFFNKTGGYPVKKGSRSIIETVSYTIDLLKEKRNMVLLFPQGRIESQHIGSFIFEKGAVRIINEVKESTQVVFVVNLVEYFSHAKPSLYMYMCDYDTKKEAETAYNEFYASAISNHLNKKEEG